MTADFTLPANAHPAMQQGLAYWRSAMPGPGQLPGRQHIDPLGMPALLPHVWLLEVHPPGETMSIPRFRFRLVGSHVDIGLGGPKTGAWLHEMEPGFEAVTTRSRSFVAAASTGEISHRRGAPRFRMNADAAEVERLILPLATNGYRVDMLLGFTIFFDGYGALVRDIP